MKKISTVLTVGIALASLMLTGCAAPQRVIIGQPDGDRQTAAANDETRKVLFLNPNPFWVRINFRDATVYVGPGKEYIGFFNPPAFFKRLGNFSFIGYAYSRYDGESVSNSDFVGEQEFSFYLSGYPQVYNGRVFGAVVSMSGFPISQYGFPTSFSGTLLNVLPWGAQLR